MASLLYWSLPDLNWVGFYLRDAKSGDLLVGPFQGKPACVRIPLGRGVCGTAAAERRTVLVEDVHEFPGHIACDSASNSEVVVPVIAAGELIGVLDLDSPVVGRFDAVDAQGLERLVEVFVAGHGGSKRRAESGERRVRKSLPAASLACNEKGRRSHGAFLFAVRSDLQQGSRGSKKPACLLSALRSSH